DPGRRGGRRTVALVDGPRAGAPAGRRAARSPGAAPPRRPRLRRRRVAVGLGGALIRGAETGGQAVRADVVVVGAGPAGAVMARRLAEGGADVLLLESGEHAASPRAGLLDV